jgi:zinc D-Ala-D-Ala carboxypeptidase
MLTENFDQSEFTFSQTAARLGIDNTPPEDVLANLHETALGMEEVRTWLGKRPILISSGYRSPALNAAVQGSQGSQHLLGQAVDFTCPQFGTPAEVMSAIVQSKIQYDQVILEFNRWVHISFSPRNRRVALVIDKTGTRAWA